LIAVSNQIQVWLAQYFSDKSSITVNMNNIVCLVKNDFDWDIKGSAFSTVWPLDHGGGGHPYS